MPILGGGFTSQVTGAQAADDAQAVALAGTRDAGNSNLTTLGAGLTWTGTWVDTTGYAQIVTSFQSTQAGTFTLQFSSDGSTVHRSVGPYALSANTDSAQPLAPIRRYYRAVYANTSGSTATLAIETRLLSTAGIFQTRVSDSVGSLSTSTLTRSVLFGEVEGSSGYRNVSVSPEGHLEVVIQGPTSAFGEILVASGTPVVQQDFAANEVLSETTVTHVHGGASTPTAANGLVTATTGAAASRYARVVSRRALKYRAGQGAAARFTAVFSAGAANSEQWAGPHNEEAGAVFGYSGASFGICRWTGGKREVRTLTITTNSNTAENVTVTLNGSTKAVAVTASGANNAANRLTTALQIAAADYTATGTGWDAYCNSASNPTVVFVSRVASAQTGTYSVTGTTIGGSFAQTQAGAAATPNFVAQTAFNIDRLDGTGSVDTNPSGMTLNPAKGNVYQVDYQYLGFGRILWSVETPEQGQIQPVHIERYTNANTTPSLSAPTMPIGVIAKNTSNTTSLSVSAASWVGMVQGEVRRLGLKKTYQGQASVNSATYVALFTLRNPLVVRGRTNYTEVFISDATFGSASRNGDVQLVLGATLGGSPAFTALDSVSALDVDIAGTSVTGGVAKWGASALSGQQVSRDLANRQILLAPGETLTFAVKNDGGGAGIIDGTLSWEEDP